MSCKLYSDFVIDENGGVILDWTVMGAAIIGLGIAAVAAVQTGLIGAGGRTAGSFAATTSPFTAAVLGSGGDVQINDVNGSYIPIATDQSMFMSYLYELADKSRDDLSSLYRQYIDQATAFLRAGDYEVARASLDVAGAISEVMSDYRYPVPKTDPSFEEIYGALVGEGEDLKGLATLDPVKDIAVDTVYTPIPSR